MSLVCKPKLIEPNSADFFDFSHKIAVAIVRTKKSKIAYLSRDTPKVVTGIEFFGL